jgi:hypothetical protein
MNKSRIYYDNTFDILKRLDIENKNDIKKRLKDEANETLDEPIVFLKDVK